MCQHRLDPSIVQKLNTLFSTYACFKEQPSAPKTAREKANHREHREPREPRGNANAPVSRPSVLSAKTKDLDAGQRQQRETLGLMNKLSPVNQAAIWEKLARFTDNDNSKHVVPGILESVVYNAMYIDLIVDFLRRLQGKGVKVIDYVTAYVTDVALILKDQTRFASTVPKADEEYDEFCAVQKQKRHLQSKLKFCLALPKALPDTVREVDAVRDVIVAFFADNSHPNDHIDVLFDLCWTTAILPIDRLRKVYMDHGLDKKVSNRLRLLTRF